MDGDVPQPDAGMCSSANPANALRAFNYAIVTNERSFSVFLRAPD
jgi:hypothetical protein